MAYCHDCGEEVPTNAAFCSECGAELSEDSVDPPVEGDVEIETADDSGFNALLALTAGLMGLFIGFSHGGERAN